MAGHHQIWTLDLAKKQRSRAMPATAARTSATARSPTPAFAQPSGLATDGKTLYVADSEVSAIRAVPLDGKGEVRTIVGEGLFEFGDVDGVGDKVRLQHALGVAYHDGKLYVADTYNSKIKVIDPKTRSSQTYGGENGWLTGSTVQRAGRPELRRRASSTSPTPTPTASAWSI